MFSIKKWSSINKQLLKVIFILNIESIFKLADYKLRKLLTLQRIDTVNAEKSWTSTQKKVGHQPKKKLGTAKKYVRHYLKK